MLFEKLSNSDKDFMDRYINSFAVDGASKARQPLDYLMRFWDEAKSDYLYRMLGNSFFATKKVDIVKDEDEIAEAIEVDCFNWRKPGAEFQREYNDYIRIHYIKQQYASWGGSDPNEWNLKHPNLQYWALERLLDCNILAANVYDGPTVNIEIESRPNKAYKLNKGAKVSRTLGQLVDLWGLDKENFESFRIAHSMCLNEKHFQGTLTLSIHPIDYMTMSDNANNWQSCMNWMDNGEFKRGTVEMMNSPMVVVAYLTSKQNILEPWGDYGPSWNSKTWRELFIVTPAVIAGVKGYPFWNKGLETQTIMFIRELAQTNLNWGPYNCEPITFSHGETFHVDEFDKDYYFDFVTNAMYNDFYSKHQCVVTYNTAPRNKINYSGVSECLCCGRARYYDEFENEGFLYCSDCDGTVQCSCCDHRDDPEYMIFVDDMYFCESCYDSYVVRCPECGEDHYEENMNRLYVAFPGIGIFKNWSVMICNDCWDDLSNKGLIKTAMEKEQKYGWYNRAYDYIYWNDMSDSMKDEFGYTDEEALESAMHNYPGQIVYWADTDDGEKSAQVF